MKKSKFITRQFWLYMAATFFYVVSSGIMLMKTSSLLHMDVYQIFKWTTILAMLCDIGIELFAIAGIFYAVKLYRQEDFDSLLYGIRKLKLGTVPYYIAAGPAGLMMITVLQIEGAGIGILPPNIATVVVYYYLFEFLWVLSVGTQLAMTGAYGISYVKLLRKQYPEYKISWLHYVLQILPVLDIISSYGLVKKHKRFFS